MASDASSTPGHKSWLYHPEFPSHWERCSLYSMARWVNGLAFRNIHFSQSGKPVIKIAEVKSGISSQTKFTEQTFDDSVRVRPGDLLFCWSGQPETSIGPFWWHGPEGWLNQHVFRVLPEDDIDPIFFYCLLGYLQPQFIAIARNKQTTGLGHVTKKDLENIEAAYPGVSEQRAIARIIGTLDDKIDLNRRMNETLESMARALFKSWFVDFDPVHAKTEGRDPGLPKHLADLFPARFTDSEIGEIPEEWEVGMLGDVADHPRRSIRPDDIGADNPYIALEHMPRRCIALSDWGNGDGLESNKFQFNHGEILFGKLRPYFHKVGVAPVDGICSTDIVVIVPRAPQWFGFVLGHTSSTEFVDYTDACSTGTKMPRTSWKDMERYDLVVPQERVAVEFNEIVRPAIERIIAGIHESHTLAALRDGLLPKLISGELRIKDAECLLTEPTI